MGTCESSEGMLAGVCSRLANRLGWNVWAIRAVLLILLVAEPLWTAIGYGLVAAAMGLVCRLSGSRQKSSVPAASLQSPDLASRKQRISDLEQRFRKWEQSLEKD